MFRRILVIVSLLLLSSAGTGLSEASDIGKAAPVFELKDLEGKKVSLADFKGKVILLNFWATWCAPCKAEMPSIENLYKRFKDKGLIVIGVSVDNSETTVRSFVKEKGLTFPILLDKGKEVSFDDYGVIGLPVTFLIDKKGIIVDKVFGERQWDSEEAKEKIKRLLEGR